MHIHITLGSQHFSRRKVLWYWFKTIQKTVLTDIFNKASKIDTFCLESISLYKITAYLKDSKPASLRWNCNCHWLHRGNLKERQMSETVFSKHLQAAGFTKAFLTFYSTSLVWSRKRFWVPMENTSGVFKEGAVTVTFISVLCAVVSAANRLKACRATTVSCWEK